MWQGRVYRTPPKQPDSCPRRGLGSGAMASWLLGAILMISTLGRTSNQGCLLPRRAHALDGAGQQTTARRHRGLLPDREPTAGARGPGQHSQLSPSAVTLLGSRSYPPSAEHREGSSGRESLSERPRSRISGCRAVPASGSAGSERWPGSHDPPSRAHGKKKFPTFSQANGIQCLQSIITIPQRASNASG